MDGGENGKPSSTISYYYKHVAKGSCGPDLMAFVHEAHETSLSSAAPSSSTSSSTTLLNTPVRVLPIEVKTSNSPSALNRYKTNWNFGGLRASSKADLEGKWLAKMEGGLLLDAVNADTGRALASYRLDGPFMARYIAQKSTLAGGKSKPVNLGCCRCSTCGHYHRLLWLHYWSTQCNVTVSASSSSSSKTHAPLNLLAQIDVPIASECAHLTSPQRRIIKSLIAHGDESLQCFPI
jgi:hypothetical protein